MAAIIRSEFIDWDTIVHFTDDKRVVKINYPCVKLDDIEVMTIDEYEAGFKNNGTIKPIMKPPAYL